MHKLQGGIKLSLRVGPVPLPAPAGHPPVTLNNGGSNRMTGWADTRATHASTTATANLLTEYTV